MGYATKVTVNLAVNGGGSFKEESTIANIVAVNSKQLSFCSNDKSHDATVVFKRCDDSTENRSAVCQTVTLSGEAWESIAFVAIKASRYIYSKCGKKESGVAFKLNSECAPPPAAPVADPQQGEKKPSPAPAALDGAAWILGDKVIFDVASCKGLSSIAVNQKVAVFIDKELFDCTKKDPEEIIVTVTYGLIGKAQEAAAPCAA